MKVSQIIDRKVIRDPVRAKEEGSALQKDCWARGRVKEPDYGMRWSETVVYLKQELRRSSRNAPCFQSVPSFGK